MSLADPELHIHFELLLAIDLRHLKDNYLNTKSTENENSDVRSAGQMIRESTIAIGNNFKRRSFGFRSSFPYVDLGPRNRSSGRVL